MDVSSFGKYLRERGAVTPAQLEEATQSLVIFGGRLGTNLVELGALGLDELEQHLSRHLGIPRPPADWVERPDGEALKAVPVSLAERSEVVPLRREGKTLHVAMVDPGDPNRVDDLAFATGLRIRPYVLAEAHLRFLMQRYYGIRPDLRYVTLGRYEAQGETGPAAASTAAAPLRGPSPEERETEQRREALGIRPLEADEELIDPQTFSSLHQRWTDEPRGDSESEADPAPEGRAPEVALTRDAGTDGETLAGPADVAGWEAELSNAPDRDAVVCLALRLARAYASTAALFVVRDGVIQGNRAVGTMVEGGIQGILVPHSAESVFTQSASTGEVFRGAPPRAGIDGRLLRALRSSDGGEVAILPIAIRDRIVNLLYVDNGSGPLGETAFAALRVLCDQVAAAYERLILERKRRHC